MHVYNVILHGLPALLRVSFLPHSSKVWVEEVWIN